MDISLSKSTELDNSAQEGCGSKLCREAHLLLGGLAQGTAEHAEEGFSAEKIGRTVLSFGLAAGLTIAMRRPGMLGNIARGAGFLGGLNMAADLANPRRLAVLGEATSDTWNSSQNFDSNFKLVKSELGPLGFDTFLGIAGGAAGGGLASRFMTTKVGSPVELFKAEGNSNTKAVETGIEQTKLIPAERAEPLNVFSRSNDALGKALSNFAHTPFELDGVKYASVEAFYQGLKYVDPVKRAEIAPLFGTFAKSAGNKAPKLTETLYMGEKIALGSPEHHALMERAIRAKIEQNPAIKQGLLESDSRPIVHDTGKVSTRVSNFPDTTFAEMLSNIRADLTPVQMIGSKAASEALGQIEVGGGRSSLVEAATRDTVSGAPRIGSDKAGLEAALSQLQTRPQTASGENMVPPILSSVSDSLLGIKKPHLQEFHNLEDYADAFKGFDRKVSQVIGGGSDSIVLKLEDGNVLKITTRELPVDLGERPFDLPVLEQGSRPVDGRHINYFVQPFAQRGKPSDLQVVGKMIDAAGYHFNEPFVNQVGTYQRRAYLLDPFAATPLK